ncbi:MAG TPA: Nramp family divalent metal transporter [Vitreimonas sp.]|nr:Nramp family divalent metal transporter [Vitreimonas sp.]
MSEHKSHILPTPPSLFKTLGPSFILLGLALGSGELIMWPYLTAHYGLGLLWGALLGISFQYVLNTEVMRYSLAWGESIFVGFRKLSSWLPLWFIISTFVPWSLPGFSSASADIINHLLPGLSTSVITVALLVLTGLVLTAGKTLYKTMERFEKAIVFISIPFILGLVLYFTDSSDWHAATWGVLGRGEGWWWMPGNLVLTSFLGAFAYSGGGGNLNLAQSHYIKEKGFGMGAYASKITSLLAGGNHTVKLEGELFSLTPSNKKLWAQWWWLVSTEHALVFWMTGFITIMMLAVLSYSLVYGQEVGSGLAFLYYEASAIQAQTRPFLGTLFLMATALMLFSTQVIVLEASSRIISENILLLFYKKGRKFNLSMAFYLALWAQIVFGIGLLFSGFEEPRFVLTLAAALNAGAMLVAFPLVYLLNTRFLPVFTQPAVWRKVVMIVAFGFFAFFVGITVRDFTW